MPTTYEIVVSAEKNKERINRMILNYNKLGFQVKVIPGKQVQKISVASFTDRAVALDSLEGVKKKLNNPDAYIYTHNRK
ncbi:MAG: hypothetical protein EOP48_14525 [Sphingobacteriales bacterium]|nr:MAG: hypothetical protein EOP48_14525 [Sphingobacteriales bacterium]